MNRKVLAKISKTVIETAVIVIDHNNQFIEYVEQRSELDSDNFEILSIIDKA